MHTNPESKLPKNSEAMSINLESILPSLAKSLYGEDWRISIRELLQNAHDAIAERLPNDRIQAHIDIIPDLEKNTLTFRDNGIGMTLEEVRNYLATVGYGLKREQIQKLKLQDDGNREALKNIIGQYGIGFLSSFIIAERVEVKTRSLTNPKAPGVRAVFTGETKWYNEECPADVGTSVTLTLRTNPVIDPSTGQKRSLRELLAFAQLVAEVRRFGDLLPFPIYVSRQPGDAHPELANATAGPWEKDIWNQEQLIDFLKARRPNENAPLWAEPFKFSAAADSITAHGFLYIPNPSSNEGPSNQSVAGADLFCRRMFITDNLSAILPDWATFVGIVVECPDLTPTLDRNGVVLHDHSFVELRQALGKRIIESLVLLATKNPANFGRFLSVHADRLFSALIQSWREARGGAEADSFFGHFIKYLPFNVMDKNRPQGQAMTIPQLIEESRKVAGENPAGGKSRPTIYFLGDPKVWGQYRGLILQKGYPVIVPSGQAEEGLIRAYSTTFPDEALIDDVRDVLDLYVEKIDQAPYEQLKQYLKQLDGAGPDEVNVSKFQPVSVPAMMTIGATRREGQAEVLENFLQHASSVLDIKVRRQLQMAVETSRGGQEFVTVTLNASNPVIEKLRFHCHSGRALDGLAADVLHEIYHNARALSDPSAAVSEHYFEHRTALLGRSLDQERRLNEVESSYEAARQHLENARREQVALAAPLQNTTCAMLATDLRGSTNMVGFLDSEKSAEILRCYANELTEIVRKHGGRVEKFTGDGIFAYFQTVELDTRPLAAAAADCAVEINAFTIRHFMQGAVSNQLVNNNITIQGSRTVLHFGEVRFGGFAGAFGLVGRAVVLLFRALARKELFDTAPIIMTGPFKFNYNAAPEPQLIAKDVHLDDHLPTVEFYAHPAVVSTPAGVRKPK